MVSGNGQCALTASQAGNTNYAAAPTEVRYVYINKGDQSITFDPLSDRPLNPNTFMVSATASSGLSVTFQSQTAAKCTVSGTTVTLISTGTCTVRARQTGNGNWAAAVNVDRSFAITAGSQASQTITFNALADKVVTDAPFSIAASATATSNLTVTFTSATTGICTATGTNGATITLVAPGTCTINANQAGNAAYLPAPQVTRSFNVADTPKVYFVHPDHLGTPRAITNSTDNTKVWEWRNDEPFGDNQPNESPSGQGSFTYNLRFPGQYFDQETGTSYNYFRDYSPAEGRYIQSDPMGLDAGPSTYAYVESSPIADKDPFGLLKWRGSLNIRGAGLGKLGGQKGTFELESECDADGKKGIVTVEGYTGSVGVGFPVSETWGTVEFNEYRMRVDTELFNGRFRINSIGVQVGVGLSGTRIFLGDAMSTNVDDYGLDIGVQAGVWGKAKVVKRKVVACKCEPENR